MELSPSQDCFYQAFNINVSDDCGPISFDPGSLNFAYKWLDGTTWNAKPLVLNKYAGQMQPRSMDKGARISGRILIQLPALPVGAGPPGNVTVRYSGETPGCQVNYRQV